MIMFNQFHDEDITRLLNVLCEWPEAGMDELAELFSAQYHPIDLERVDDLLSQAALSHRLTFDSFEPCSFCGLREVFCARCGRPSPESEFHIATTLGVSFRCRWRKCGSEWFVPDWMYVGTDCAEWQAVVIDVDAVPQLPGNGLVRVAFRRASRGD
jgi:hypothetical protein